MITASLDNLLTTLKKKGHNAKLQQETQQIYIIFKLNEREFPLFIKVFEDSELLQLLAFIPCNLKTEMLADVGRLLHLFNKELDVPGFGMDEATGVIFYRCIIPTIKHKVEESVFDAFLSTIQLVCKSFSPPIEALAQGAVSFEEMMKKAQDEAEKIRSKPS